MATPFLPSTLPLLPLPPPHVLYPHLQVSVPLSSSHLALVLSTIAENAKVQKVEDGARMIAVVPVVEIERRVGRWATAARVKRIEKSKKEEDTYLLVLDGLARIRLPRSLPPVLSILPPVPLTRSTFSFPIPSLSLPLTPSTSPSSDLIPLAIRLLPTQLHDRLKLIPASLLADLLVTVLGIDWELRVELLGIADTEERCSRVREILLGTMANRGIEPSSPSTTGTSTSTALIRRPSSHRDQPSQPPLTEDLAPLQQLLSRRLSTLTTSARKTIERELSRLAKIPPQSAEYGVGRTYIEWLLALPWKKVSETGVGLDLEEARKRLESEHEGLEGVKQRVIEYLAVYRLKKQLFTEEKDKKQKLIETKGIESAKGTIDASTADDLLDLIPQDERKDAEMPMESVDNDDPPGDVYRDKGPILLLVGPPGVGKTSIARSLAAALGRKYHRISLGGVRDEAEIRGHRRTYVGALPGAFVQGLRKVGVSNPLFLLDELDKIGTSNFHGDPSAALLETLDPAQNWSFHDHYLGDVPLDLSQCMFIATANTLDTIPAPLLDRCEVIECPGYVTDEKLAIARRFLLPKQVAENGMGGQGVGVEMGDEVLLKVITDYTFEAGVRSLEREIGKICRTKAVEYSWSREKGGKAYEMVVKLEDVERILGLARFEQEVREEKHRPGVVTGMAYRGSGSGGILLIETTLVPGGQGRLVTTGSLGEVITESAELALAWVKSHAVELGITQSVDENPLKNVDIHLHLPAGAVKKDGPSAGVGMILALVGLLTGRSLDSNIAVTGEITLRGAVTPVGGIKEKVLGAHRAGISRIIMPKRNRKDVQADLPESLREEIDFVFVSTIEEVLQKVWGSGVWKGGAKTPGKDVRHEARL